MYTAQTRVTKTPFAYYFLNETVLDVEFAEKHREIISENAYETSGNKLYTVTYKQVLQTFGSKNWNGRTYQVENTKRALDNNPLIQYDIQRGTWTSEYGHPSIAKGSTDLSRQMSIDPTKACNTIDKYWFEGNVLYGISTTLSGSWGDVLRDRILTGYPAMASSRAVGGVDAKGNVLPGYTIVTYDTVIRPSHKEAYGVSGSEKINTFKVPTPTGNVMTESVAKFDYAGVDVESFKNFILSESSSKESVNVLCETLGLDYNSMRVNGKCIELDKIDENSICTIKIPIKNLVNMSYYNLFL